MAKLSVLFVTPYFAPAWEYGGIPRASYDLARSLIKKGIEIYVITTDAHNLNHRLPSLNKWRLEDGINIFRLANLSNRLMYKAGIPAPFGGLASLQQQLPEVDIIHLHGHRHILNHIVVDVLYRKRIPYILSGHGSVPAYESKITLKKIYDSVMGRRILDNARLYIAVSKIEVLQLRAAGMKEPKIRTIYNPVPPPPERLADRRGFFRADWQIPEKARLVLFLGKITPRKGVDILLRAFKEMNSPDKYLAIAGSALGKGIDPYINLSKALGIEDRVIFTGHLAPSERFHALQDADVTAYPATNEIFGLASAESLMVGTPVVACDDCGMAEILRITGGAKLVPFGDAFALAEALDALANQPKGAMKAELERASKWIYENLNPDKIAEQTIQCYADAIASH